MLRLLSLLLLLFVLPAHAGLFDKKPSASFGGALNNSSDFLPVREAFRLSLAEATPEQITLRFVAAEGYYLYRHRFAFKTDQSGVVIGEPKLPAGVPKVDDYFGEIEAYYGIVDVELPLTNPDNRPFVLQASYQGCADKGLCYPPETESLPIGDVAGAPSGATTEEPTSQQASERDLSWRSIALFFLFRRLGWLPHLGIAVATAVGGWLNAMLLWVTLIARGHFALDRPMLRSLAKIGLASAVMGIALFGVARLLADWFGRDQGFLVNLAALAGLIGTGFAVYALAVLATGALRIGQLRKALRRS
mgnify:CR=1 FL=1